MSSSYLTNALVWLAITVALYLLMNGAQIFETALVVPAWTAAPPESLAMFQGKHRLDFKAFWIAFHSVHEITFILALVFTWRVPEVRWWLLVLLAVHVAVRVWTIAYFAPTIIEFQRLPEAAGVDPALVARAARWRTLNDLRVAIFLAVNFAMLLPVVRVARLLGAASRSGSPP